jgi:hypothetical protein
MMVRRLKALSYRFHVIDGIYSGKNPLNVTAIMGSLNSPYDFNYFVQNFTYKPIGVVVKGGEEITLEYQFQVHPMLEPVDFTFASVVFYESDELAYSNTFFNQVTVLILADSNSGIY